MPDQQSIEAKAAHLAGLLRGLGSVAVAYSGGVDSTYLLAAALDSLGPRHVLAVTIASELAPAAECALARRAAAELGAEHVVLDMQALAVPGVAANGPDRCYYCKREVLALVGRAAARRGLAAVLHGANCDDRGDHRPGSRAAAELGARAPLDEAGLTKADIRELSPRRGLGTWDAPSQACLASRVPYHTPLTAAALERIGAAEAWLHEHLGLRAVRVRDHLPVARLEVQPADWPALLAEDARTELLAELRRVGYHYVALDLAGLRSGSMNDVL